MTVRLYADVNVSWDVVNGLLDRGVDIIVAQRDQAGRLPDDSLLERVVSLGRVLVTHDSDFLRIAREWQHAERPFTGIAFARQEVAVRALLDDLELVARGYEPEDIANRVDYVPFPARG